MRSYDEVTRGPITRYNLSLCDANQQDEVERPVKGQRDRGRARSSLLGQALIYVSHPYAAAVRIFVRVISDKTPASPRGEKFTMRIGFLWCDKEILIRSVAWLETEFET